MFYAEELDVSRIDKSILSVEKTLLFPVVTKHG